MPEFAAALADGAVSVGHVDVITHAVNKLDPADRDRFAARSEFLAGVAERSTVGEFARTVRLELLRTQHDDGLERLARQKRDTYLKTWVDPVTGMWCLRGEFDPETGATLANRLAKTIEKLFHDHTPDTAPTDPLDKQHHLRALALAALATGTGSGAAAVDMSILIDYTTLTNGPHDGSLIDLGLNITLPLDTIQRMACLADITPIIVGADGVHLHLGHDTRTANRHQRQALRAMYHRCAIHGCDTTFEHCQIHHIHWWRHQGPTNIDNLLPLCNRHHHYAHEGGWKLTLAPDRTLTITQPNGTTMTHAPPKALAA
jgi:hypothetical protein